MKALVLKSNRRYAIVTAVNALRRGGIIIYPTETSYGIGADATNGRAVRKIFKIKAREKGKPVSIIVSSLDMARKYALIGRSAGKLAKKFMPGPLTLVTEKKSLPDILSKKTIAWRIPSHAFALALAKKLGKPITSTSANRSGEPPLYKVKDVTRVFSGSVSLIIDGSNLPKRKPSTIFDATRGKIIRKGPVSEKDIAASLRIKNVSSK